MKRALFLLLLFALAGNVNAQKKGEVRQNDYLQNDINVDGKLTEWTDSLKNFDARAKMHYVVGNNDSVLYLAVKTSDPLSIRKILIHGFSFMVNKETRKKVAPAVIFPYVDRTNFGANRPRPTGTPVKMNQQVLAQAKGVVTSGFKDIIDGNVSLQNEYGIKAASTIDDKNVFRYELAIPLNQLELGKDSKNILTYSFRINGIERTVIQRGIGSRLGSYGYGPYGSYPYGSDTYARTISEAVEFREKYTLATK